MIKKIVVGLICIMNSDMFAGGACSAPQVAPQPQPVIHQTIVHNNTQIIRVAATQQIHRGKPEQKENKKDNDRKKDAIVTKAIHQQKKIKTITSSVQAEDALTELLAKYSKLLDLIRNGKVSELKGWNQDAATLNSISERYPDLAEQQKQVLSAMARVGTEYAEQTLQKRSENAKKLGHKNTGKKNQRRKVKRGNKR